MKLKKLEITGFKSFVEKTAIEFPPSISAIVGPNGCGKSNILDALRWAMGEQSVRQLRGKAMEDVIFAGTNGKPPMNMAEVSLVLSNDNGSAPEEFKDFTEIMVTRRLYRSGESAYLINKQPCRLKDIYNIFLGSGMGAKSYSIIQQGNIGAITEAGPEERRAFLEEAAGVTRYKSQKAEALRKLDATNQNLLRLNDIIAEVERQMKSLNRQAKKAQIYKNYQERIRKADILAAFHYFGDMTRQIQHGEALLKELKDADMAHSTQLKKLDAAIEEIKLARWQKNQKISTLKSDKFEKQRNIDRIENELAHLKKEAQRLLEEAHELKSARTDLEAKNRNMSDEIAVLETQSADFRKDVDAARLEIEQDRLGSLTIREQLVALNKESEERKAALMESVTQEARYKNTCQNAANNRESLKRRIKRADEEVIIAIKKLSECEAKEKKAAAELESLQSEIEGMNADIERIREQLDIKSKALGSQVKLVQMLESDRSKFKSKFAALKKMEDNFEGYKDGVKAIMKRHSRAGILGLVADVITPQPSFEIAVEAALGDAIQYVIINDQQAGFEAIDYLKAGNIGRSGFVQISGTKLQSPNTQSLLSPLLNFVSIKPGFEHAARTLLGNMLVAETREQALIALNCNPDNHSDTIVTKDGEVISGHVMIGGSQDNLSGILAKKQEIRELEAKLIESEQALEKARREQKELENEARELESDLQKSKADKNEAVQEELEKQKAIYKVTEELKHARRHLDIMRSEQEQLTGEDADMEEEAAKYHRLLAEVENEVKAAQDKVLQITEQIAAASAQLDESNQKSLDLKLKLTALTAKLENTDNSLRRLKDFQEDSIRRLEQLERDVVQKEQKRADSQKKMEENNAALSGLYESMGAVEKTLAQDELEYEAIDASLKEKDSSISGIQKEREETLQKLRTLEIEQSQRELKRENISARIMERYHQPLADFEGEFSEEDRQKPVEQAEADLADYRKKIERIGEVNIGAIAEYETLKTRFEFLDTQRNDLNKAIDDLHKVIRKINKISQEKFLETFNLVNQKLAEVFPKLFNGGTALLTLTEPEKPLETGVEFMIHPPGKKLTRLSLLSGGEKALSAIAFIFSIFLIKPASFCIMDEIDAPLDEANVIRFNELLRIIGEKSQIVMITHKKRSMEFADMLFGVTMEKKGISQIVSVNFDKDKEQNNGRLVGSP